MRKRRLNLTYIFSDSERKAVFKRRKKGILKKLDELKVLCDVDACAIIYNPFINSDPDHEVWPSNEGVHNVLHKVERLTEANQILKSVSHEEFLIQEITKVQRQNKILIEDNKEKFMTELMFTYLGGNMGELVVNDNDRHNLCEFIDQYLKILHHHRNVTLNNPHLKVGESSSMVTAADMAPTAVAADMAPTVMAEAGSSSFLNAPVFNSSQLTNDLQSNQGEEHVNSLANNFLNAPIIHSSKKPNELGSMIFSNQQPEYVNDFASLFPSINQEVYTPAITQDEVYPPNQNQNQQDLFVEEMMKLYEQTSFPGIEETNHSNHHQF